MTIHDLIVARRDAREHSLAELEFLAKGAADGSIPDYQLAAWLMAAYLNPLGPRETAWMTAAMAASGERMDLSGLPKPWVDKHSTGGVGDKTSIVLLPLLAACGLTVVKMSGRGLGITGGTIDKLDSVPGFNTNLTPDAMKAQAARIGVALTGQTPRLAPADKALYALRDATDTVRSVPLIVSSILSKKLAGGAQIVVLDVKAGSGAFMKTVEEARELAGALEATAQALDLKVVATLTDMDQPLGRMAGNALEIREALDTLACRAQGRFRTLCEHFAGVALHASGRAADFEKGKSRAALALDSGAALEKAIEWFAAQGATIDASGGADLPTAGHVLDVSHDGAPGWVARIDAQAVGEAVVLLGGGRAKKEDAIDPAVGIELACEVGDRAEPGQLLFRVHARDRSAAESARERVLARWLVSAEEVAHRPVILPRP
ncbi:MAG: thymidine phosphorylase [Fimbriimonadaceae bacterium]|nr:thymidine phosphorylase [Chthonomonadaceae bacterium]MCO5295725.1 thymidine phosphorylase [Fimbriimonadaceae bacterium]